MKYTEDEIKKAKELRANVINGRCSNVETDAYVAGQVIKWYDMQNVANEEQQPQDADISASIMPSVFIVKCKWSGEEYGCYSSEAKARNAIESKKLIDVYVDSVSVD